MLHNYYRSGPAYDFDVVTAFIFTFDFDRVDYTVYDFAVLHRSLQFTFGFLALRLIYGCVIVHVAFFVCYDFTFRSRSVTRHVSFGRSLLLSRTSPPHSRSSPHSHLRITDAIYRSEFLLIDVTRLPIHHCHAVVPTTPFLTPTHVYIPHILHLPHYLLLVLHTVATTFGVYTRLRSRITHSFTRLLHVRYDFTWIR